MIAVYVSVCEDGVAEVFIDFFFIPCHVTSGKSISLLKVKNVTSHVLNQVALKCPSHFQIVHCQGGLGVQDVMKFIENVGSYLKVSTFQVHVAIL